jgi:hypothetical protein
MHNFNDDQHDDDKVLEEASKSAKFLTIIMCFHSMQCGNLGRRLRQMLIRTWPGCVSAQRRQSFVLTVILHGTKLITSVKLDCVALYLSNDNVTALAFWYTQAIRGEIIADGES